MNQTFVKSVTEQLPQLSLMQDEPMKKHTTFRIGGPADYYAEPDVSQISKLIEIAKACDMPVAVIGNGSNLLVGDKGIRGLVIGIGKGLSAIEVTEAVAQQSTAQDFTAQGNSRIITAGAGAILAAVAAKAAEASLSGLEFASGIPGSVGGAVVMNAGAYGGEIKDVLIDATVLTADGELKGKKIPRKAVLSGVKFYVFRTNFSLHLGQVMEIFPLPRGTRTVWRHLGQSK